MSVKKLLMIVAAMAVVSGLPGIEAPVSAQQPDQKGAKQNIPVELQVVVSRYQGDKRISSLPYLLSLKTGPTSGGLSVFRVGYGASLRLGSQVPIRTQVVTPAADGKPATTTESVNYQNVGMQIDCGAVALEDGRYEVTLTINESSVVTDPQEAKTTAASGGYPLLRSYQSTNTLFVKDGQTTQFTAATDRVSGEVVRVEVKLTVVK
jgi:type II/III secretion system protein